MLTYLRQFKIRPDRPGAVRQLSPAVPGNAPRDRQEWVCLADCRATLDAHPGGREPSVVAADEISAQPGETARGATVPGATVPGAGTVGAFAPAGQDGRQPGPDTAAEALPEIPSSLGPPPTGSGDDYLQARLMLVRQEYAKVLGYLRRGKDAPHENALEMANWEEANQCLTDAYGLLEGPKPDARAAAGAIWQASQLLVWYRPSDEVRSEASRLADQLEAAGLHSEAAGLLRDSSSLPDGPSSGTWSQEAAIAAAWDYSRAYVAVITAMGQLAQHQQEEWINDDLQVARLRHLLTYVGVGLALTLAATLITVNPSPVAGWPVQVLSRFPSPLSALMASLGVTVVGAAGGLFSGLLVTQGASATLVGYRTSVLRLQLKPPVGGLVACLAYMPLSWQVVPGITVKSGGTFLLIAFATGFSERYILKLLNVTSSGGEKNEASPPPRRPRRTGLHPRPAPPEQQPGKPDTDDGGSQSAGENTRA